MKKLIVFLVAAVVLFGAVKVCAQEKSAINVKSAEVNNGVVIVDVQVAGKAYELQCNQGMPKCTLLKSGKYQMIELPANTGTYDCKDVVIYGDSTTGSEADKKIGEYCLVAK